MSLPIRLRPIARLELDEAMAWYEKQKEGLGTELKEAIDQMFRKIGSTPGDSGPCAARCGARCSAASPTPSILCPNRRPSSSWPSSTPNATRDIWKDEVDPNTLKLIPCMSAAGRKPSPEPSSGERIVNC